MTAAEKIVVGVLESPQRYWLVGLKTTRPDDDPEWELVEPRVEEVAGQTWHLNGYWIRPLTDAEERASKLRTDA